MGSFFFWWVGATVPLCLWLVAIALLYVGRRPDVEWCHSHSHAARLPCGLFRVNLFGGHGSQLLCPSTPTGGAVADHRSPLTPSDRDTLGLVRCRQRIFGLIKWNVMASA